VGRVARSVLQLTMGWTVRDRIPVGTKFSARPDRPWGLHSLLYNGYRIFPRGKVQPGRAADHSPPSSAAAMEEYSYNSTHPLGHTEPETGSRYLYLQEGIPPINGTLMYCFMLRPHYLPHNIANAPLQCLSNLKGADDI